MKIEPALLRKLMAELPKPNQRIVKAMRRMLKTAMACSDARHEFVLKCAGLDGK